MQSRSRDRDRNGIAPGERRSCRMRVAGLVLPALFLAVFCCSADAVWAGQTEIPNSAPAIPEAPQPQLSTPVPAPVPCPARGGAGSTADAAGKVSGSQNAAPGASASAAALSLALPCPHPREKNGFERFLTGPEVKPLTPREKARLAARNVLDPFNGLTILGASAIAVSFNSHSPYGPGMSGFGRYVGVSYSQDMTDEFFGVFLIPSIVHQDPYYHRMPNASIPRRIDHAIAQVVWTQSDNGRGMVNYANLVGFAIDDEIGNFYVPGQQTNLPASAESYGIAVASAPIENFINEFLPDVARRIHVRVVVIQRIINHVARTSGMGAP